MTFKIWQQVFKMISSSQGDGYDHFPPFELPKFGMCILLSMEPFFMCCNLLLYTMHFPYYLILIYFPNVYYILI